jgi:4,5-DOPA dioxygenase extradiol
MDIDQLPDGARGPLLPSLFISHGAPTLPLDDVPARHFIKGLGARLGRPRAVLVVSPHWESEQLCVTGAPAPATIHDFFGFPAPLYALRYPAPGAPALAGRVVELLGAAGYAASVDPARGLDHGAWVPLMLMYPAADVPVLQLSVNPARTPGWCWRLGRALAGLRAEGVLVIGSGSMTHNLGDFRARRDEADVAVEPYAEAFADWFADALGRGDLEALLDYRARAPAARRAHPTDEHLLPLYVALGAAGVSWSAERVHRSFTFGSIAMDAYLFHTDRANARLSTCNEINLGVNHAH